MNNLRTRRDRRLSRLGGFSMVEALVALVVIGVGMLGIASLYVVTLRSNSSAIARMQAVNLATDIGDRIRANRTAREAYEGAAAAEATCLGKAKTCTAAEMAAHDLYVWQQQIAATLPSGTGSVAVDGGGSLRTYTITISWLDAGDDAGNRLSYVMRMQI